MDGMATACGPGESDRGLENDAVIEDTGGGQQTTGTNTKRRKGKSKESEVDLIDNTSANQTSKNEQYSVNLPGVLPGSTLRNVVYYQNRFIVLDTIPAKSGAQTTNGDATTDVHKSVLHTGCGTLRMSERNASGSGEKSNERTARAAGGADDSLLVRGKRGKMEMDASSVTMDARAIEIVVSDESDSQRMHSSTRHPLWKRITSVMRDNRMKGRRDCDVVLRDHPEEYIVLKRVLNIVFVTIGVALLLSVFIVIIYTSIVGDPENIDMRRGADILAEANNASGSTVVRQKRFAVDMDWDNH
ncbi:uncharacterized protein LOC124257351 [Haliotis rubra]|uniref:uncharacterized protein LOC124257351 n=1 Tax=Haliotis rubra TaxID=36100 RepID=UPI001EE5A0C6|nr:uncharacterized protein LOC124257351 [Haliotis rubra]